MNVRSGISPIQPLDRDLQVSSVTIAANESAKLPPLASSDQANPSNRALLGTQLAPLPDVRTEKVQAMQLAIASGNYTVSSMDVADSLMEHMLGSRK